LATKIPDMSGKNLTHGNPILKFLNLILKRYCKVTKMFFENVWEA